MREVLLKGGKVAIVDDEDFAAVSAHAWYAVRACQRNDNWYARRNMRGTDGKTINIYMHRQILGLTDVEEADHRDRDGLNNTRANLRRCTRSQNCANIIYPKPASGYRGVVRHQNKWRPQATVNDKTVNLGTFDDPAEAARVRDDYVYGLYGEFAVLNFPDRYGSAA